MFMHSQIVCETSKLVFQLTFRDYINTLLICYLNNFHENQTYNICLMPSMPLNPDIKIFSYKTTIGFSLTAFLIFLAIIYGQKSAQSQITFTDSPFQSHVYCPISSKDYLKQYANLITNAKIKQLKNKEIKEDIYVVYVQARPNGNTPNATAGLYYCGLARTWLGSCQDAKIICSSPGPMFYMRTNNPAYIIWVNDINTKGLNWPLEDCYSPETHSHLCTVSSRLNSNKLSQQGCAYKDPTSLNYKSSSIRIDRDHVPISPHIHGLSIRPVFDGNPLSWFDNNGNVGVGYYSLDDPQYFQQFSQVQSFYEMPLYLKKKSIKINFVSNAQPPGFLFYHDHAMKSTKYNVKNGLAGLYIIYDHTTQKMLPSIQYEKFIVFSASTDGDARQNLPQMNSMKGMGHKSHQGHSQKIYTLNVPDVYERNSFYRLRVLNAHFDNAYTSISFSVYYKQEVDKKGKKVITEIDASNITYDLSVNQHKISFTMIGADSTIFQKFIPNLKDFDLGSGERAEILIRFDEGSGVPKGVQYYYLTCDDGNADRTVIKYKFQLTKEAGSSKGLNAVPIGTNNPYKDLSLIDNKRIVLKRMRPLLNLPREQKFVINGHYMFENAASDNPKIGTVEDWYFINTLPEAHPIHLHLVNFQVVQTFSLKMIQDDCTLFQVDYLRSSGYYKFKNLTDKQLCDYINNNITSLEADEIYELFNQFYLENQSRNIDKLGRVSGFNVLQSIGKQNIVTDSNCSLGNIYKYICQQTSRTIPEYYRRWKETAMVNPFSVSVFRIRWTMTEYDEKIQAYPYFKIPQDQLMEFPGFVYHCHILPHEDNQMMRPYMLQPSDVYVKSIEGKLKSQGVSCNKSSLPLDWSAKQRKINAKLGCNDYP